jgi:hypothetical protein
MATAPVSRRLNLTRDQLAQFLTDQQQIRQFELLFSTVDTLQVIVGTDFEFQADNAAATANEALAQIQALSQNTGVEDAVVNAKVNQTLSQLAYIAQEAAVNCALAENKANQALELLDNLNKAVDGLQMTLPPTTQVYPSGTGIAVVTSGTAWGTTLTAPSGAVVGTTDTQTLTNKRITPRVSTPTVAGTYAIDTDSFDMVVITGQNVNITDVTTTGTPTNGQKLWFSVTGTAARTIAFNASNFESSTATLPTTTVGTDRLDVGFVWNPATSKWRCVAKA